MDFWAFSLHEHGDPRNGADWRTCALWLTGRLGRELDRHGVARPGPPGRRERPDAS